MSQSWPCTTILQKRAWQGQRPGMTHVPLNSPHTLSPSPTLHAPQHQKKSTTATRKSHFPPNGQALVRSLRNQNAMQHTISIYAFPIERTHTTNFQKGKIAQKRPLFDLRFEKATKIEIEIIDSDDKDVSGSDHAPLRQIHIHVSPLDIISPAYHLSRVRLQGCGLLKIFRFTYELPRGQFC
jgi:hypothetical protein